MNNAIAILAASFDGGGVSRMLVNLANGLATHEKSVIFFVKRQRHPYLDSISGFVNLVTLDGGAPTDLIDSLAEKLGALRPRVLLSGMLADHQLALETIKISPFKPPLFFRSGTNYLEEVRTSGFVGGWQKKRRIRKLYRAADGVICVSQGVAEGLASLCDIPVNTIHVLNNPTVTPELLEKSRKPIFHPWFREGEIPVILGVGSLSRRKNFELLIRAFARVKQTLPSRLVIIGDGRRRERLLQLAGSLGVGGDVQLPGFIANPYPYMKAASLLVLSSNREGSPNVLVEAMATGTPVVATDCPSGPREILRNGKHGKLVPMDDEKALAQAITESLIHPPNREALLASIKPYCAYASSAAYCETIAPN